MKIDQLEKFGITKEFIEKFKNEKIKNLFPPQEMALKKGLVKGQNLVLSCPTASGKTLIATLAIIKNISERPLKIVYIVPLIALANEKYSYYKEFFKGSLKVAISVGDLDSEDFWLKDYDLIIATSEKMDSLIRHGIGWIEDLRLIIADEIHLLNDVGRGPTLEILLTLLKRLAPKAQILALSATIRNALELSLWLNAKLVSSDFRPVKLYEGVSFDSKIKFLEKEECILESPGTEGIVLDTLKKNRQILIFTSTRRSAESLAEKLIRFNLISSKEREDLASLSKEAIGTLETPTKQCKRLASVLKSGIAFHHAGLIGRQKRLIEENFRRGLVKIIVATPTLAMGINIPAFRVIVRDVKRYYLGRGSDYIPILEYKQFSGRAGRPQYDEYGESIILAKSEEESEEYLEHFIKGEPENIESKLAQESVLRMHTLSLISCKFSQKKDSILNFYSETFFGFQYKDVYLLERKLEQALEDLKSWEFISEKNRIYYATRLGKRISELYLDPKTAFHFVCCLGRAKNKELEDLAILQMICDTDEMQPLLSVKPKDILFLNEEISKNREDLLTEAPSYWQDEYENFLRSLKTALGLKAWCNEISEDDLLDRFNFTPGELHSKLEISDWLIYCLLEISNLLKLKEFNLSFKKLRMRLLYGIREELLELVSLREIGRIRARRLYENGIRDISTLKKISFEKIAYILGPKTAQTVIEQITTNKK